MSAGGGDATTIIVGDKSGFGWGSSKRKCVKVVRQGYVFWADVGRRSNDSRISSCDGTAAMIKARREIQTTVTFLTSWINSLDKDDWE